MGRMDDFDYNNPPYEYAKGRNVTVVTGEKDEGKFYWLVDRMTSAALAGDPVMYFGRVPGVYVEIEGFETHYETRRRQQEAEQEVLRELVFRSALFKKTGIIEKSIDYYKYDEEDTSSEALEYQQCIDASYKVSVVEYVDNKILFDNLRDDPILFFDLEDCQEMCKGHFRSTREFMEYFRCYSYYERHKEVCLCVNSSNAEYVPMMMGTHGEYKQVTIVPEESYWDDSVPTEDIKQTGYGVKVVNTDSSSYPYWIFPILGLTHPLGDIDVLKAIQSGIDDVFGEVSSVKEESDFDFSGLGESTSINVSDENGSLEPCDVFGKPAVVKGVIDPDYFNNQAVSMDKTLMINDEAEDTDSELAVILRAQINLKEIMSKESNPEYLEALNEAYKALEEKFDRT